MVSSRADTVEAYLKELPAERSRDIAQLRSVIREHLPQGFQETMQYGMIAFVVPTSRYPDTYNGQPLAVIALASQKNYMSLYLSGVYGSRELREWFEAAFVETGKKLDMGKSCVRFKRLDDLPLEVIGEAVSRVSVDGFVAMSEAIHGAPKRKPAQSKPQARSPAKKPRVRS
jgi:hypothetical protein